MATRYVPLTLDLVEEGSLKEDTDREIAMAIRAMHQHVKRAKAAGRDPKGAKAIFTLKLTIRCVDEDTFDVKGETKTTLPARPAHVTTAMAGLDDDGDPSIMVRASGSTAEHPRQGKLATSGGAAIVDGEPQEPVAPLPGGTRPKHVRDLVRDGKSASAGE